MAERVRVREIDDDEGRRLLRIIRRGTGSVVTWRRAQARDRFIHPKCRPRPHRAPSLALDGEAGGTVTEFGEDSRVPYQKLRVLADTAPSKLAIWKSGTVSLHALLLSVAVRYVKEVRRNPGDEEVNPADDPRSWANVTARLIEWCYLYSDQSVAATPSMQDVEDAVTTAQDWEVIEIGLQGGRAGRVRVFEDKQGLAIDPLLDPGVELIDIMLEKIDTENLEEGGRGPSLEPAFAFFRSMQGRHDVHRHVPHWVAGLYVQHMKNYVAGRHWEMPLDTELGGITVGEAIPLIGTLKGLSFLQLNLFRCEPNPNTAYLGMTSSVLKKTLSRYNPKSSAIDKFVEMLTYGGPGGKTPFAAPIIPWDGKLLMPFPLLSEGLVERMILRAAASNPASSGKLGESLGGLCAKWSTRLGSISGVRTLTEVKVLAHNRRKIGDLDIVALDADGKTGLIVEAKWPIDVRVLSEAWKQEDAIDKGKGQIGRLKREISNGAIVKLPPGWPPFSDVKWEWMVGTPRFLDSRKSGGGIRATSLRLVEQLLPVRSTGELIEKLDTFPYPLHGRDFELKWKRIKVDGTVVRCRVIETRHPVPSPPANRMRSKGWT
ncbi:hypothetical protein RPQ02_18610 [Streptomyces sp. AM2-3-1]|uniref:hypothetical protein n=1 Tax=Streptomyces sp. AM2-3-1 TaxID=3075824 RepID=UPI0028C487E5|nr:hypothetical protein [Streptomyces sp. AM2-3-1]WNO70101.1 hypothetical protein RPQ02_18610 [Streptomyces sp. AM2-3-1]